MIDVLQELCQIGAVKHGHFVLSSGLHSDAYVQCARLGEYPDKVHDFCSMLVDSFDRSLRNSVTCVVSPAVGGIIFGYEVAKILGTRFVFCERVNGEMCLRRNFEVHDSDNVIIMEDVITTGSTSIEVFNCMMSINVKVSAFASIVNRSQKDKIKGIPLLRLVDFAANTYSESDLPESLMKIPVDIPGSRFLKDKERHAKAW